MKAIDKKKKNLIVNGVTSNLEKIENIEGLSGGNPIRGTPDDPNGDPGSPYKSIDRNIKIN